METKQIFTILTIFLMVTALILELIIGLSWAVIICLWAALTCTFIEKELK